RRVRRSATGGTRRQLRGRAVARVSPSRQRRGDPLDRPDRFAGHRRARVRARRAARRAPRPRVCARAGAGAARVGPLVAEDRGVSERVTLLLGIDEGTSAVKAILFDADLRPLREARREKPLAHPRRGWVEQDPQLVLDAVVEAVAEVLDGAPDAVAACGLDHQGESVLAWDAESGAPLTPIVTWQDKRSQEVLDRLERDGLADEVRERSAMPLDPYFSAGKL